MADFEIAAELRETLGKGANRRLRATGAVPAVLYGASKDPVALQLNSRALAKQMENESFFAQVLSIKVGSRRQDVVLKDLQRDPVTGNVTHLDFMRVSSTQEIHMNIPLRFVNEETCPGRKAGGVISRILVDVEVVCLPKDLPEHVAVFLGTLEIGDSVLLSDLAMPEGVQLAALTHEPPQDGPVVGVQHAQKEEVDEVEEGAEAIDFAVSEPEAAADESEED